MRGCCDTTTSRRLAKQRLHMASGLSITIAQTRWHVLLRGPATPMRVDVARTSMPADKPHAPAKCTPCTPHATHNLYVLCGLSEAAAACCLRREVAQAKTRPWACASMCVMAMIMCMRPVCVMPMPWGSGAAGCQGAKGCRKTDSKPTDTPTLARHARVGAGLRTPGQKAHTYNMHTQARQPMV